MTRHALVTAHKAADAELARLTGHLLNTIMSQALPSIYLKLWLCIYFTYAPPRRIKDLGAMNTDAR